MAKKANPVPADNDSSVSIIKLRLSIKEAKLVRLAAAVNNQQPGVYARAVVLAQAKKDLQAAKDDLG